MSNRGRRKLTDAERSALVELAICVMNAEYRQLQRSLAQVRCWSTLVDKHLLCVGSSQRRVVLVCYTVGYGQRRTI